MRLTIVTATFNSAKTISRALTSLYSQSFVNFQHVIIDGGSTDETIQLISNLPRANRSIVSEKDEGIYDALNKGIMLSSGEVVGFLHSDDQLFDVDILREIMDAFTDENIVGVYGNLAYVDERSGEITRYWKSCDYVNTLLTKGWMPPHPALFLRRSIFDEIGLFDTKFLISGDYDFCLKFFKHYGDRTRFIDKTFVLMGNGGVSSKGVRNFTIKTIEDFKITNTLSSNIFFRFLILIKKKFQKLTQFSFSRP